MILTINIKYICTCPNIKFDSEQKLIGGNLNETSLQAEIMKTLSFVKSLKCVKEIHEEQREKEKGNASFQFFL